MPQKQTKKTIKTYLFYNVWRVCTYELILLHEHSIQGLPFFNLVFPHIAVLSFSQIPNVLANFQYLHHYLEINQPNIMSRPRVSKVRSLLKANFEDATSGIKSVAQFAG